MLTEPQSHQADGSVGALLTSSVISFERPSDIGEPCEEIVNDDAVVTDDLPFFMIPMVGRARCSDGAGTLASLFFSDDDFDIARAKAVCRTCTLSEQCRQGALDRGEAYGVWGGVLLIDGVPARFPQRRGRPPAIRVEFVEDEVPIPDHLVA